MNYKAKEKLLASWNYWGIYVLERQSVACIGKAETTSSPCTGTWLKLWFLVIIKNQFDPDT